MKSEMRLTPSEMTRLMIEAREAVEEVTKASSHAVAHHYGNVTDEVRDQLIEDIGVKVARAEALYTRLWTELGLFDPSDAEIKVKAQQIMYEHHDNLR